MALLTRVRALVGHWVIQVSVALTALVVMHDIGQLLKAVEESERRSFGARVFTGPRLRFWETGELQAAFALWREVGGAGLGPLPVASWVAWHAFTDLFFVVALGALLWKALGRVRPRPSGTDGATDLTPRILVGVPILADLFETGITLWMARTGLEHSDGVLGLLQLLSLVKWIGLALVVTTIAVLFLNPNIEGDTGLVSLRDGVHRQAPLTAMLGLWVFIALFGALIALPAGGPLEQLPDVIRAQFPSPARLAWAGLAFLWLLGATVGAGWRATDPVAEPRPAPGSLGVVLVALLVTGPLALAASLANGDVTLSPLGPLFVVTTITILAWIKQRVTATVPARSPGSSRRRVEDWWATRRSWWPDLRNWCHAYASRWRSALVAWGRSLRRRGAALGAVRGPLPPTGTTTGVAGTAAMVVLIASLGLVRAAVRPALLEQAHLGFLALGLVAAAVGPVSVAWAVPFVHDRRHTRWLRATQAAGVVIPLLVLYLLFTFVPEVAPGFATNGAIAITFGVFVLVIGEATFRSRRRGVWWATRELGLGHRSPWLALAIVSWLVVGLIETTGGYHEVRDAPGALATGSGGGVGYTDLDEAHQAFVGDVLADPACRGTTGRVPMLLVAAPGGGIRAAYWTASVLEELEALSPCGRRNVFAVSAVSGGSVGTAVWLTSPPGTSPSDRAERLGRDDALAQTIAALLTRDLLQPFTGIRAGWTDRAGVQARSWIDGLREVPSRGAGGARLDHPWPPRAHTGADTDDWVPVVVLNAASVVDGCRVLVTNVGGLPASSDSCLDVRDSGSRPGPVTASLPAFSPHGGTACDAATPAPTIALAALTSARFPLVSPSGAIRRCPAGTTSTRTTYAVDGGYFENTGLMTLLQLWSEVEESVDTTEVEPWIVLADNGYRSEAVTVAGPRPRELLIPWRTRGANQLVSSPGLQQMARSAMSSAEGPRFARLGPVVRPSMTAPLGWVLSAESVTSLCRQLTDTLAGPDPGWNRLAELLHPEGEPPAVGAEERRRSCD